MARKRVENAAGGLPEPPPRNKYREQYGVIAICKDENDQRETYERPLGEGYAVKVVTT